MPSTICRSFGLVSESGRGGAPGPVRARFATFSSRKSRFEVDQGGAAQQARFAPRPIGPMHAA
jgi:hypothetical protein